MEKRSLSERDILTTTATTRSKLLNALLHEALEPTAETFGV